MKFYCFPQKQIYCSVYSSYSVFKTRLFSNFILQTSPRNSFFFRIRKTLLGHLLSRKSTINVDVPNSDSEYIGIRKTNKFVLVEIKNDAPKWVWKKGDDNIWKRETFLGYQIISEFSLKEFNSQKRIIKKALSDHWANLNESISNIHGDFTHFNILYDEKEEIHLIDKKEMENSKLFDFYYFYAYLKQSINRNLSVSKNEKNNIIYLVETLLKEICKYDSMVSFNQDFINIKVPSICGIDINYQKEYLEDFRKIF